MTTTESSNARVASPTDQGRHRLPRVFYSAGAGDLIGAFRHWRTGFDDPNQIAVTYSGQFFETCRQLGLESMAISMQPDFPKTEVFQDGPFWAVHHPIPWAKRRGVVYHLGDLGHQFWLITSALRFRADIVLLGGSYKHWYLFAILRLFGIDVIPSMHVILWPKQQRIPRYRRVLNRLNGWFFRRGASAILSLSGAITEQVQQLSGGHTAPILPFLPTFRDEDFSGIAPPSLKRPFRVLYVGRVEREKGVFDLLEIARRFSASGRTDIEFDLCGDGSVLEELKQKVLQAKLSERFRLHGHCGRSALKQHYGQSHVVIAPTTTAFIEGFNKVVAEGVLSGRPVITSSVCPALEYVREAVVEVPPDDVSAYETAILKLADDPNLYADKQAACQPIKADLLDAERTYGAVLSRVFKDLLERQGKRPNPLEKRNEHPFPIHHQPE